MISKTGAFMTVQAPSYGFLAGIQGHPRGFQGSRYSLLVVYHGPGLTVAVKSILESWNRTHHAFQATSTPRLHAVSSRSTVKRALVLAEGHSEHGGPLYRPPGIPVLVGSDTFGRVHSGIPTHRYGGPAALKVEIRQACFQWMCRRSYTSQQAYLMVNEE